MQHKIVSSRRAVVAAAAALVAASCDLLGSDALESLRGRRSRTDPCGLVERG